MLPFVRAFTSIVAGLVRVPAVRFGVLSLIGTVIYAAVLSSIGYGLGSAWKRISHGLTIAGYAIFAIVVIAIVAFVVYRLRQFRREDAERRAQAASSHAAGSHAAGSHAAGSHAADSHAQAAGPRGQQPHRPGPGAHRATRASRSDLEV
jgi:uncharacterized membrane protein